LSFLAKSDASGFWGGVGVSFPCPRLDVLRLSGLESRFASGRLLYADGGGRRFVFTIVFTLLRVAGKPLWDGGGMGGGDFDY